MPKRSGTRGDGEARVRPSRHSAVLCQKVVDSLALGPGLTCFDLTLGAGGHFLEIARRIAPDGICVGIDRDLEAVERTKARLEGVSLVRVEIHLIHASFGDVKGVLARLELEGVDRVLIDLGVSSDQLEDPGRGFSFMRDGPLDMRQDRQQAKTAADVVNGYSSAELERVLREYGEERHAPLIVSAIVERRRQRPIARTLELAELVAAVVPRRRGRVHPATRTFQALRMEVGSEVEQLRRCLPQVAELLGVGGRMAVISFHSVEDRVVKDCLRPYGRHAGRTDWCVVRRGPVIRPSAQEIRGNPRSRSAKLRVYEKVRVRRAASRRNNLEQTE